MLRTGARTWRTRRSAAGTEFARFCLAPLVQSGKASRELTDEYRKGSFERFCERLFGVTVVTYDEVFRRITDLITLLQSSNA